MCLLSKHLERHLGRLRDRSVVLRCLFVPGSLLTYVILYHLSFPDLLFIRCVLGNFIRMGCSQDVLRKLLSFKSVCGNVGRLWCTGTSLQILLVSLCHIVLAGPCFELRFVLVFSMVCDGMLAFIMGLIRVSGFGWCILGPPITQVVGRGYLIQVL